jgi:carboxypeptidase Taq
LAVDDLPGAWREGMVEILGIAPPDDRAGCLQDIHWPEGLFGYFPTYTLGAMIAAQLFDAANADDTDMRPALGRGDFAPLMRWLRTNVHEFGASLSMAKLVERATGRPLDAAVFKGHLKSRYLA